MAANKKSVVNPENRFAQDDDLELSVEIPVVHVRLPGTYKGAMVLPSLDYAPTEMAMVPESKQAAVLTDWLASLGCEKQLQIIKSIPGNKFELFTQQWGKESSVDLPKSKG